MMIRSMVIGLGLSLTLPSCSDSPASSNAAVVSAEDAPVSISASALARAYAHDRADADLSFVGHRLEIVGDVKHIGGSRKVLTMATGSSGDTIVVRLADAAPNSLRAAMTAVSCGSVDGSEKIVVVSGCSIRSQALGRTAPLA